MTENKKSWPKLQIPEEKVKQREQLREKIFKKAKKHKMEITELGGMAPFQIMGTIKLNGVETAFYLRERWESYTITATPTPGNPAGGAETVELIAEGGADSLYGHAPYPEYELRAFNVLLAALKQYEAKKNCKHKGENYCQNCGTALKPPYKT